MRQQRAFLLDLGHMSRMLKKNGGVFEAIIPKARKSA